SIGLVLRIELLAEGLRRIVEDDGEMGRRHPDIRVTRFRQQLPQHVAEARNGADRQPVRLSRQRGKSVEGAEDETRAVDEEKMIAFFHVGMDSARRSKRPYKVRARARTANTETLRICNPAFP